MNTTLLISTYVIGLPKGQPRAKACRRGAFAGVYDPGTADGWKLLVRHEVSKAWDRVRIDGPVKLALKFNFPRPKSHHRSNGELKPAAPNVHTAKPDCDNAAKAVMDALTNLGVWKDDSQVCALEVTKGYGFEPGCDIEISAITA